MKNVLTESVDLMARMNLFEEAKPRIQVTRDEIIDMLNSQDEKGGGTFASFIYVKPQSFYSTRKNWRTDDVTTALNKYSEQGNESWYGPIKSFNSDDTQKKLSGIDGMIVVTRYNVHWTTPESYDRAYSEYSEKLHNLRMSNGVGLSSDGMLGDNHNQREKTAYGPQFNQTGKLSKDFNMAGSTSKPISTCYVVGADGLIKGEIPDEMVKSLNKLPTPAGPEKDVAEVLSGEALEAYMKAKAELDKTFRGKNFLYDRILSIVATVNGVSYYYINDAIKAEIKAKSDVFVQPTELVKIAKEQLEDSVQDLQNHIDSI